MVHLHNSCLGFFVSEFLRPRGTSLFYSSQLVASGIHVRRFETKTVLEKTGV